MRSLLIFALAFTSTATFAQDAATAPEVLLTSARDFTDPSDRDAPIVCRPGDFERQAGKSVGQLFGAEWPAAAAPAATPPTPARVLELGKVVWPRGLESQRAFILMVVLVGADGKPLRAEPLCASTVGFDMTSKRIVMGGRYEPATVDGKPVVAPVPVLVKFERAKRTGAARAGGNSGQDD